MRRIQIWLMISALSLFLAACSSNSAKDLAEKPPSELYNTAQQKLHDGNFRGAITQLEALDNRYPFGPYSQQVQLDLIYAYYKSADYSLALASIDRFIKLNPTHPNIDYVFYMRGLVDMALDSSLLQDMFGIDRFDRDPQYAQAAFNDFNQLISRYPNSQYNADARQRMVSIKNRLARFQLSIAQYYMRRGAYVAVVNRVEKMLEEFPDCQATRQGLPLLENAYKKLQLTQQADKVAQLIAVNKKTRS